jgi:HK97 gp10 family phage protein
MAINWNGPTFLTQTQDDLAKRLERAAIFLENEIKKNISEKCPAYKEPSAEHSPPGSFPFLETGELRRSITHEVDRETLVARVGSNKLYARYLEMGTTDMEARPFLAPTLEANKGAITEILKG